MTLAPAEIKLLLSSASIIKDVIGFKGNIVYDPEKPDGTPQKLLDVTKLNRLGWKYKTDLRAGIEITYQDFLENSSKF